MDGKMNGMRAVAVLTTAELFEAATPNKNASYKFIGSDDWLEGNDAEVWKGIRQLRKRPLNKLSVGEIVLVSLVAEVSRSVMIRRIA